MEGSPFATPGRPNGLVIDPSGTHLYASESQPNEMSGFSIDDATGALSTISGSPFEASFAIRTPVMDAAGKRLHVSNGTAVDCFEVDANTATLSEIGVVRDEGAILHCAGARWPGQFPATCWTISPTRSKCFLSIRAAAR